MLCKILIFNELKNIFYFDIPNHCIFLIFKNVTGFPFLEHFDYKHKFETCFFLYFEIISIIP